MPEILTDDDIRLHVETSGDGPPIVFVHEFAGDHRSWAPQVAAFSARHRCVVFAARGYPPSDVPQEAWRYSQARAAADVLAVMDALRLPSAHLVGLSMGGFAVLHAALVAPARVRSMTMAGVGYGAEPEQAAEFAALSHEAAAQFERLGSAGFAPVYASGPARIPFQIKDPDGWQRFAEQLGEHDPRGAAYTLRGVQARRPSLYALRDELAALTVPALVIAGDEDDHTLAASIFLKQTLPAAGLLVLPRSGHTLNLEAPEAFNAAVATLVDSVERGESWLRDPRTRGASMKTQE
ncbi:alpha/beta fold hydrolase [Achromobacter sp. GG226]|uniref:alpha/beta fold hydrolase n=1 Tax=Verticiella alkaliphila TaxID=2779529 RepID=UPI001C0DE314|nr:alpha/beta hydrolase [Verticiella sp. GG226]MBU4609681.1 alpha/beta fold hydrolase [Verticiella sp. GG226]